MRKGFQNMRTPQSLRPCTALCALGLTLGAPVMLLLGTRATTAYEGRTPCHFQEQRGDALRQWTETMAVIKLLLSASKNFFLENMAVFLLISTWLIRNKIKMYCVP